MLLLYLAFHASIILVRASGRWLHVWDSWVNWGSKARVIFTTGGVGPAVYAEPARAGTLLDYPLLVPLNEAWVYAWLGAPDDRLVGVLAWLAYLALLAVVYSALRRAGASTTLALLAVAGLAGIEFIAGLAGLVFAEAFLVLFAAIAGVYACEWLRTGQRGALLIGASAAGLLPWTKREGLLLLGVLVLAMLLVTRGRRWRGAAVYLLAATGLAGPWWLWMSAQGVSNPAFLAFTPEIFVANAWRLRFIGYWLLRTFVAPSWSFLWALAGGAWLAEHGWLVRRGGGPRSQGGDFPDRSSALLWVAPLGYAIVVPVLYVFSDYAPYQQHVLTSIDRLLAPLAPLLVVWLGLLAVEPKQVNE